MIKSFRDLLGDVNPAPGDDELDVSMSGGGGAPAPQGNHTNCFLDEAGSPLESQRGEKEEAEIGMSAREPHAIDDDQRMVQYLCEAALKISELPAAHLHVARTEHTRVLGNTIPRELGGSGEVPKTQFKLQVSEVFFGGMPPEVNLGTTVEEAVSATTRVFGKALDELAARVPQQPAPPLGGEDEEGFATGPLGGMQTPFGWTGPKAKYLSEDSFQLLTRFAYENRGSEAGKLELRILLAALKGNGHVAEPEPSYIGIFIGTSPGQSKESAWAGIPKDLPPIVMPCGHQAPVVFSAIDIPCPCGNPKHWLLKWGEDKLDLAAGQLWLTSKGTTVKIESRHPDHPAWRAFDQAQSTSDALHDLVDDEGYAVYIELPPVSGATQDKGTLRRFSILSGPFLLHLVPTPPAGT